MHPTPNQIRAARDAVGLTQAQAADIVGLAAPIRWSEYERGVHRMPPQTWRLFLLLTRQAPLPTFP